MKHLSIILLTFCGCTSQSSRLEADAARQVVVKYLGSDARTVVFKEGESALEPFSQEDLSRAHALHEIGAIGFLVFADSDITMDTKNGPIADFIKMRRMVFVLDGRIVGDFAAMKKEPNQALEPTAPSGRGSP